MRKTKRALLTEAGAIDWTGATIERVAYEPETIVFAQGDLATSVMYIERGTVRLSVVSHSGKEAVIAVLDPGDFFGEGCLAGQAQRMATASTMAPCTIIVMAKADMVRQLHTHSTFADRFMTHMLVRNIRIEEDLVDQLFNSSEKRLARTLLLLARYGKHDKPVRAVPPISQETLAEIVGTTRSRVNFFMKKFERLGFIDYKDGLKVNNSLLTIVLHD